MLSVRFSVPKIYVFWFSVLLVPGGFGAVLEPSSPLAKNVLIPCHDKCLAKYKLNVHSKVRRALFTTPRIVKSKFKDTTLVVSKTMFSVKTTQSESLDTTFVVFKTKIAAVTPLCARNKPKRPLVHMWFLHMLPVVQIFLWIVDNGCSKHMTGDRSLLKKFVDKFMGTVRFRNNRFAAIIGYGDYVQGNITICHIYYVEGLGHNLFSVRKFCDSDLEVVFRSNTCYVQNLEGDDLLTGARESNLYTISISNMVASSPVCLLFKAASTKYNKTSYELLHDKKPNVEYFHVFGSLCYRTNDREDLGMMKPKADIGIFIGYSKSSRGFRIYNRRTKEIMETIHVKFDELTTMASEHDSLEPVSQQFINDDSSAESMNTPSKEDLDNLFRTMYDKYFKKRSSDVSINFVAQQVHSHEDSPLTSLIIVKEHEAPPIVTTSEE
nr:integrase, catalytic region, zinc finger, CCHC-type, peptidase aspartic, catalytic [Tanacetum cinerariifolium]